MKSKEITVSNQEIHINKDDYYFTLSPKKWIDGANAIGIISKACKYKISVDYTTRTN